MNDGIPQVKGQIHIVPVAGKDHVATPECWCKPVLQDADMYLHNMEGKSSILTEVEREVA